MHIPENLKKAEPSLTRDILYAARYYLSGRRGLFVLGGIALFAGLAFNWGWLVAAGAAPLILGVAPCLAMCALGLCMSKGAGRSCSSESPGDQVNTQADSNKSKIINAETLNTAASVDSQTGEPLHQETKIPNRRNHNHRQKEKLK
jgi:hypothetical protein